MLCPNCKQSVADGARFCGSCGKPLGAPADSGATLIRPSAAGAGALPGAARAAPGAGAIPGAGPLPGAGPVPGAGPSAGAFSGAAGPSYAAAAGALPGILERVKNMLLTPKTEWQVIEPEPTTMAQLYTGYVIPLAAIAALARFIQSSVIGYSIPFIGRFRVGIGAGLTSALVGFVSTLVFLFILALIIDALAPTFTGQRDQRQALKTAIYAYTPAWAGSVLYILPLGTLLSFLAAIYGIYVLALGLPVMMRSPRDKTVGYTAAVIICAILAGIVLGVIMYFTGLGRIGAYNGLAGTAMTQPQQQQQAAAAVASMIGGALGAAGHNAPAAPASTGNTAADAAADPAANAQAAAAAGANLLTALGGAMSGGRHVDPVDFHTLEDLLPPALPGMQRTHAQGNSGQALGVKASSATGNYAGDGGTSAEIKISDAAAVAGLMDLATTVAQNSASESDTGFEKTTVLGGRAIHEKYDNRAKHGELDIVVAKRFAVEVRGDGVDVGTLETYASLVDYSKLESLKDVGAHAQ